VVLLGGVRSSFQGSPRGEGDGLVSLPVFSTHTSCGMDVAQSRRRDGHGGSFGFHARYRSKCSLKTRSPLFFNPLVAGMMLGPKPYYYSGILAEYGGPPIAIRCGWMAIALLPFLLCVKAFNFLSFALCFVSVLWAPNGT
jgi:hypothetical protein